MAVSWDDILSNYHFDSNLYSKNSDPTDLSNPLVSIFPSYPILAYQPNRNWFLDHDYSKGLSVILPLLYECLTLMFMLLLHIMM